MDKPKGWQLMRAARNWCVPGEEDGRSRQIQNIEKTMALPMKDV